MGNIALDGSNVIIPVRVSFSLSLFFVLMAVDGLLLIRRRISISYKALGCLFFLLIVVPKPVVIVLNATSFTAGALALLRGCAVILLKKT